MESKEEKPEREVLVKLTKDKALNSWMAYIKEDGKWRQLRPAKSTFESAHTAIFDGLVAWAFPHYRAVKK